MSAIPPPFTVTVHGFISLPTARPSTAYERGPSTSKNALVFIGGLTGGPHTTDLGFLSQALAENSSMGYSLWEFRMRSSFAGFGFSSLANDAEDISGLVRYLRQLGKEKIILMGASTGCQDCLEYLDRDKYPHFAPVDGYILQSPISDREAALKFMTAEDLEASVIAAKEMIDRGEENEVMPNRIIPPVFGTPVTAYRWYSIVAKGGDDDYFSSDLSDERVKEIWGKVNKPIMILPGKCDEMVPPSVNRVALLHRWSVACDERWWSDLSTFIPGADHIVSEPAGQKWLGERVVLFLGRLGV
ncbi:hypothetical protein B0H66DRAFT_499037 [Apodospora peruviana]|uniref:Uncharacterized protein n=1 Tax=Apodospora peruviana TaxID=516989 RepID=A0AAE0HZW5_9PEZI|nr:hypothetical protein B0H66DRAFT_499037 [Apodospora peruviana]